MLDAQGFQRNDNNRRIYQTQFSSVQSKKIVNGCEVHLLQNLIKYGGKKLALSFSDEQGVKMSHFIKKASIYEIDYVHFHSLTQGNFPKFANSSKILKTLEIC